MKEPKGTLAPTTPPAARPHGIGTGLRERRSIATTAMKIARWRDPTNTAICMSPQRRVGLVTKKRAGVEILW